MSRIKRNRMLLALPDDIDSVVRQRAIDNDRSINGEIVHLLRRALRDIEPTTMGGIDRQPSAFWDAVRMRNGSDT